MAIKSGIYTVVYNTGDGKEYDDGEWEVKAKKTIRAEKVSGDGIFSMHDMGFRARIGRGAGNPIWTWNKIGWEGDENTEEKIDDFIVYFNQAGIPYSFTPKE